MQNGLSKKNKLKKQQSKNVSLKELVVKVTQAIKKPFSKTNIKQQMSGTETNAKPMAKTKMPRKEQIIAPEFVKETPVLQTTKSKEKKPQPQVNDVPFAENKLMTNVSSFFYTSDAFFDTLDDQQLYKLLIVQYKGLDAAVTNEREKRDDIIRMLENEDFIESLLKMYNMDVFDLFKFLFRLCPSVFKGLFVRKVQNTIKEKRYAKSIKCGNYKYKPKKRLSKRCSLF